MPLKPTRRQPSAPTPRATPSAPAVLEALEGRAMLSTDLVLAGFTRSASGVLTPYLSELRWENDGSLTGSTYTPTANGPSTPTPTTLSDFIGARNSALRVLFEDDDDAFPLLLGSRFDSASDHDAGWFFGLDEDTGRAEFAAVTDRPLTSGLSDLPSVLNFQLTHIAGSSVITRKGTLSIGGTSVFFNAVSNPGDPPLAESAEITELGSRGRFTVQTGNGDSMYFFLSRDETTLFIVDLDSGDGDTAIGFAVLTGFDLPESAIPGQYRIGLLADGEWTEELVEAPGAGILLDLDADGSFQLSDLNDFDSGVNDPGALSGTWTYEGGSVILDDGAGITLSITIAANANVILPTQFVVAGQPDDIVERPLAIGTRIQGDPVRDIISVITVINLDDDGDPLVYDLRDDDQWHVADILRLSTGDQLTADADDTESAIAFDGRLLAIVASSQGLFAYERGADGFWSATNLTAAITGAANITSSITVFTEFTGTTYVAGLTAAGHIVVYTFDPDADSGAGDWDFTDLTTTQLEPKGLTTPVFAGPLISYVTRWNGLNIAGLDAAGDVHAVWSGDGGHVWSTDNLSDITGAAPLTSGLTAYLTSWGGINIAGLDASGHVLVNWWVPAFGPNWRQTDLTAFISGPAFASLNVASYVAPWGGLNIAGLNADGDLVIYWWSMERENNGLTWTTTNMSDEIFPDDPKPSGELRGLTTAAFSGELDVFGVHPDNGDLLRYFFRVSSGLWDFQNVTDTASDD